MMTTNWTFSVMGALALSCFFPRSWAPWCDLDLLCRRALQAFMRTSKGSWSARESAWRASYGERVSLFKYAAWGLVLILVLPLNSMTDSSWFVDQVWHLIESVRHSVPSNLAENELFSHTHDWRDAPYELWEVCVFLWVFPIIGRWIRRDYLRLADSSRDNAASHFRSGEFLTVLLVVLSGLGAFFLVVVEAPRYRLLMELAVVLTLAAADLYFCRKWLALDHVTDAVKHLEIFLTVDLGALIAFLALFLFLEKTSFSYKSHWSHSFVAGASALNLLFANTASIVSRGVQNYREQRKAVPNGAILVQDVEAENDR